MNVAETATKNEILRGLVGSTAHGINIVGQDDRDEMGIFIEPPQNVCGLTSLDHHIWRTQPDQATLTTKNNSQHRTSHN